MTAEADWRLYVRVFYRGPWEILIDALYSLEEDGEIVREIKEGGLRERLADLAEKADIRWRAKAARRIAAGGRKPREAWRRRAP